MRPRLPSPAMVVAIAALIVATTGSAIAANHYLLTSTKQISPKVLKQLRGATGARGLPGPPGANGANGANGSNGANGTNGTNGVDLRATSPLASGQTESGVFADAGGSSTSGFINVAYQFAQPLATGLDATHVIETSGASTTHCPGAGQADPGYLCVYRPISSGVTPGHISDPATGLQGAGRFGAALSYTIVAAGSYVQGSWSVTAP